MPVTCFPHRFSPPFPLSPPLHPPVPPVLPVVHVPPVPLVPPVPPIPPVPPVAQHLPSHPSLQFRIRSCRSLPSRPSFPSPVLVIRMLDTPCTTIRTAALADAKTVVVGWKNQGWKPSVKTWWPPFVAKGDKIVFKWNDWRRKHNVVSVSDWNYNLCFFGKSDYKVYVLTKPSNKGRLVVLVTLDVSDKKYYRGFFTSSVGNDCRKGMKVALLRPALR
ncbi:unnamed protein product [Closterium sp. NIES-65]|nr:unnamed protein product [Closterium sp. NIES-65]